MVNANQLEQNFQFVKDTLLEEVISESLIHSAYKSIKTCLPILDKWHT